MQVISNTAIRMHVWELVNTVRSEEFKSRYATTYGGRHLLFNPEKKFTGIADLNKIDSLLNKPIKRNEETLTNQKTFDVVSSTSGSFVNMDAYMAGEPEDMYEYINNEATIFEDLNLFIALNSRIKVEDIQKAADRIYKYVTTRPANVQLNIILRSDYKRERSNERHSIELIIASHEDYLTDQIINLLGSAMLYRYFLLSYRFCVHDSNTWPEQMPDGYINFMTFNKTWEQ